MQSTGTHSNGDCLSSPISLFHPISPGTHLLVCRLPPLPSSVVSKQLFNSHLFSKTCAVTSALIEHCRELICFINDVYDGQRVCVVGMFWMVSCKCVKSSVKLYSVCVSKRERERLWSARAKFERVNLIKSLRRGLFPARYCVCLSVFKYTAKCSNQKALLSLSQVFPFANTDAI